MAVLRRVPPLLHQLDERGRERDEQEQAEAGEEAERGRLSWTEPSPGPVFRNAVVLDLAGLDSGKYRLRLRTWWPGQVTWHRCRCW